MVARVQGYFKNISDRDVSLLLLGFFAGAITVSLVAHFLSQTVNLWVWLDGFAQNFGTEMFGAFLTFLLIEVLVSRRREREARELETQQRKDHLIRQMSSLDDTIVSEAVEELRTTGWLGDGSLEGASLSEANLASAALSRARLAGADLGQANLYRANLSKADLIKARLVGARLRRANLRQAELRQADLSQANLDLADLRQTDLRQANLSKAELVRANLRQANLVEGDLLQTELVRADLSRADLRQANLLGARLSLANLSGANLVEADLSAARLHDPLWGAVILDDETTLPDGSKWSADTDMTRFTHPDHPAFWRSDDPASPAYRGDDDN